MTGGYGIDNLLKAREMLYDITPLKSDCGIYCNYACCDDGGEDIGMLLFPGEEKLYNEEDLSWMRIIQSEINYMGRKLPLFLCNGKCPRQMRPLACRIFPLGPKFRGGEIITRIDARALTMCPVAKSGINGLQTDFVNTVQDVFDLLAADSTQRDFLIWTSKQIDRFEQLRKRFE